MTTLPASSSRCVSFGVMLTILAFVWTPSVTMPACAPVSETAGTPIAWSAIAVSAVVVCSPVASRTSISRSGGAAMICLASLIRPSVTPPIAETTTTIWLPRARLSSTRRATFLMRSASPTEVPPYFWTIRDITIEPFSILSCNDETENPHERQEQDPSGREPDPALIRHTGREEHRHERAVGGRDEFHQAGPGLIREDR